MRSLLSLLEIELGSAEDHLMTVSYEVFDKILEVQCTRTAVHKSDVVHREA